MTIQVQFWDLVGLLVAFIAFAAGILKVLFAQEGKRQDERFAAIAKQRDEDLKTYRTLIEAHARDEERLLAGMPAVSRKLDEFADETAGRIGDHAESIARLEEALRRGPSHEDFGRVHERMDRLAEKIDTMTGQIPGLVDNVRLILNVIRQN